MRSSLLKRHGIEPDPRYRVCAREALIAVGLFAATGVAAMALVAGLGIGRAPEKFGWSFGVPSYLFFGVIVTQLLFLVALALVLRFVYRDVPLESERRDGSERDPLS